MQNDRPAGTDNTEGSRVPPRARHRRLLVAVTCLTLLLAAGMGLYWYLRGHADQIVRRRLIATLQARFLSPVEVDHVHLSVRHGIQVTGSGLRILNLSGSTAASLNRPTQPTVFSVASFRFAFDLHALLKPTVRVITVYAEGAELDIPPRGQRGWKAGKVGGAAQPPGARFIARMVFTQSRIVIETAQPGKLPLVFRVASLVLDDVGERQPLGYQVVLTNPKPVGEVRATGRFGPWINGIPSQTALEGNYSFLHADLGTIHGMGGTLSSTGSFTGRLGSIRVVGETETPNLTLTVSQHPMPVHTRFLAEVDGTTGNTFLKQVDARVLNTTLHAVGSVVRVETPQKAISGHAVDVTVTAGPNDHARIEDVLLLGAKKTPPVMRGAMTMEMHVSVPPGHASLETNVDVQGWLKIHGATFESAKFQQAVDNLSGRAERLKDPKNAEPPAQAAIEGQYELIAGVLHVPAVSFEVPGATAALAGQYLVRQKTVDFKGILRTDASASAMTTGWKSALLTPFDSLLKKDGAGMQIPVIVSGPRSAMKFSVDLKRLLR